MSDAMLGVIILLAVSLTVRILPTFLRLPLSDRAFSRVETIVPVVVLVNLAVYNVVDEVTAAPVPGLLGTAALVLVIALVRLPVIVPLVVASAAYGLARFL